MESFPKLISITIKLCILNVGRVQATPLQICLIEKKKKKKRIHPQTSPLDENWQNYDLKNEDFKEDDQ